MWLADGKAYQVQGCRLEFGARVVGALVVGHAIDDAFANTIARQTGGSLSSIADRAPLTTLPPGVERRRDRARDRRSSRRCARRSSLGGTHWFAQLVPVPGYSGEHKVEYLLLRSIDEALAPGAQDAAILLALLGAAGARDARRSRSLSRAALSRPIDALVARTQAIARGDLAAAPAIGPDRGRVARRRDGQDGEASSTSRASSSPRRSGSRASSRSRRASRRRSCRATSPSRASRSRRA